MAVTGAAPIATRVLACGLGLAPLLVMACGGDGGPAGPDAGTAALADVRGSVRLFEAVHRAADGSLSEHVMADALLVNRPIPSLARRVFGGYQVETAVAGDCHLLEFRPALCEQACVEGFCVEGSACVPFLVPRSAGVLTFDGARTPLSMRFMPSNGYTRVDQTVLDLDLFAPGDRIDLDASGEEIRPFGTAVAAARPLAAGVIAGSLVLEDDRDRVIRWTRSDQDDARVRLSLLSPNRAPGTPAAAIIECDVADRGVLVVPSALIAALPPSHDRDCAAVDCPDSSLVRYQRAVADTPAGAIELLVGGAITFRFVHNPDQGNLF